MSKVTLWCPGCQKITYHHHICTICGKDIIINPDIEKIKHVKMFTKKYSSTTKRRK